MIIDPELPWLILVYATAFVFVLFIACLKGWICIKEKKWKMPKIEHNKLTKWNWMICHPEKLTLGENTDIGAFTYIQAKHGVHIGENVQIGSHCSIYTENTIEKSSCRISIRPNTCIGAGTVIIPRKGMTHLEIGSNTIIGAMSLVKDDIPDNCIAYGIPATVRGYHIC